MTVGPSQQPDPSGARMAISAPWPRCIRAGMNAKNPTNVVVTVDGQPIKKPPDYPAVTLVLEYGCRTIHA